MLETIKSFFQNLIDSAWLMLQDFFIWAFENGLGLAIPAINALSEVADLVDFTQYISALPPEVIGVAGAVGIGEASAIVVTSLIIRITLQLIPFVRLGS